VPYTFFENGGLFEYIFFEDARSFRAKVDLIKKYKLRGFSAWVLGNEDPKVWEVLENEK
jgi:spore germination protein YaaH